MPAYPKPGTVLGDIRGIKHAVHHGDTRSHQNPDDVPLAPPNVSLDFQVREKQSRIDYDGIASCDGATPNLCASEIGVYVFQMRACKQNGDPVPNAQLASGEQTKWTRLITRKDAADMNTPHAVFERVPSPKEWYFQTRARVIDRIGHLGDWSTWTAPIKPVQAADPVPPTPISLTMTFDRVEKDRHHRYRCIATCAEINNWDIPGGDDEGDIDRYEFELRKSTAAGVPDTEAGRRHTVHQGADNNNIAKTIFFPVRKGIYYVLRARAIDRFNRHGLWSSWTGAGSVSDTTAPPVPVNVYAEGLYNHVDINWDDPLDVNGDPDEDVNYFQVQRSSDRNFTTIVSKDLYIVGNRRGWDTRAYKQRFWLRVRSVDASGNKSGWLTAGPISPQKATASRTVAIATGTPTVADIDWSAGSIDLAGSADNRAYNVSGTSGVNLVAWVEGEYGTTGIIETTVQFSPTVNRTRIGVVFHYIDASNFMYIDVEKTAATGSLCRIRKVVAGVDSSLTSYAGFTFADGQAYDLLATITAGNIFLDVNGNEVINFPLSAADQTTFNTATKVGLYLKRGSIGDDDGGSRHESFKYTYIIPTGGSEVIVNDSFDRTPSTTSLGIAESGQTWTTVTGVWGIVDESTPSSLFGYSVTVPILYMEDATERNAANIGNIEGTTSGLTTLLGQGGHNLTPVKIDIDRPTRIILMAWANVMNESTVTDINVKMFAVVEDWNGVYSYGRQTTQQTAANDAANGRRRLISTVHQVFLDPGTSALPIKFWFGYRQSEPATKAITIANQKMLILLSYAPDFDPTAPYQRVPWTKSASLAKAYRGIELSD